MSKSITYQMVFWKKNDTHKLTPPKLYLVKKNDSIQVSRASLFAISTILTKYQENIKYKKIYSN